MSINSKKAAVLALCSTIATASLLVEPGVAQEGGKVDVHMHLSAHVGERRGTPPRLDFESAATNLVRKMDDMGVDVAIVMPLPQLENQHRGYTYERFLAAIGQHPGRLRLAGGGGTLSGMILGTDPDEVTPAVRREFREQARAIVKDGAVAFGEMAALHFSFNERHVYHQTPADHPLFLLLAEIAAEQRLAIDLHMEAVHDDGMDTPAAIARRSNNNPARVDGTLGGFERLLAHDREARIVWQHIGWDNTGKMTVALVSQLLERHPNLYLAIKIVHPHFEPWRSGGMVDDRMQILPEWRDLLVEWSDRFVIGSDEFVGILDGLSRTGPLSFRSTWAILDQLPPEVRPRIGGENAIRIYRLE